MRVPMASFVGAEPVMMATRSFLAGVTSLKELFVILVTTPLRCPSGFSASTLTSGVPFMASMMTYLGAGVCDEVVSKTSNPAWHQASESNSAGAAAVVVAVVESDGVDGVANRVDAGVEGSPPGVMGGIIIPPGVCGMAKPGVSGGGP